MPPLKLTAEDTKLLASASENPRTALDYYMRLPKSYFSIMPDSRERRVTYIERATLSDDYLHARRWFECNGGGFEVTLKLYRTPSGTFIVIKKPKNDDSFAGERTMDGEPSIDFTLPSVWRYSDGFWSREPANAVPKISRQSVLKKYHHNRNADPHQTYESDFISIDYKLSPSAEDIVLMGSGNFESGIYEYGRLRWNGKRFIFVKPST